MSSLTTLGVGLAAFGAGLRMIPTEPLTAIESMITNLLPMVGGILSLKSELRSRWFSITLLGVELHHYVRIDGIINDRWYGVMGLGLDLFGGEEGEGGGDPMDLLDEIKI